MHDLIAITALGGTEPRVDDFDGLRIAECPDWAMASVAARLGQEKACKAAARKFLGFALPDVATSTSKDPFTAFWTGPNQWMIEAPHDSHEDLAMQLRSALAGIGSVTEQTDGWVRFDLTGPRCHDVMERLCNVNIRAMQTGAVTRTRLEHLGCFVMCRTAGNSFSVIGPRSSAASIHHALTAATQSAL